MMLDRTSQRPQQSWTMKFQGNGLSYSMNMQFKTVIQVPAVKAEPE